MKKLVLKKEIITRLTASEQVNIKGGGTTENFWDCTNQYFTYMNSHLDPANCIIGYTGSDDSYCDCNSGEPLDCASNVVLYGGCLITD